MLDFTNESMNTLLHLVDYLSMIIAYDDSKGALYPDQDLLWGYADMIYQKRIVNLRDCRCSLQQSIDFDICSESKTLLNDVNNMMKFIIQHDIPYKLHDDFLTAQP